MLIKNSFSSSRTPTTLLSPGARGLSAHTSNLCIVTRTRQKHLYRQSTFSNLFFLHNYKSPPSSLFYPCHRICHNGNFFSPFIISIE